MPGAALEDNSTLFISLIGKVKYIFLIQTENHTAFRTIQFMFEAVHDVPPDIIISLTKENPRVRVYAGIAG